MESKLCASPNCEKLGGKTCYACLSECYRSIECQKSDHKIHKIPCPCMENGGTKKFLPFLEVSKTISELCKKTEEKEGNLCEY